LSAFQLALQNWGGLKLRSLVFLSCPRLLQNHKNTFVVVNPHAARGQARRLLPWLHARMRESGLGPDQLLISETSAQTQSRVQALAAGSRVIVCGGDGSVHHLLPELVAGQHSLGLIQMGTGNDCARALGLLHLPSAQALWHTALSAKTRAMDLGQVTISRGNAPHQTAWFASSMCAGLDALTTHTAHRLPRFLGGTLRYAAAAFIELLHLKLWQLRVLEKGTPIHEGRSMLCSVLNTHSYGGGMPAAPGASVADGQLNMLLGKQFNKITAFPMLPLLLLGQHTRHPQVLLRAFTELRIESLDRPLPLALDGEYCESATALQVRCVPGALQVADL
jgi:diacylglycerol kinase family enzyme